MERLRESLDLYHMNTLKEIAEHLNIRPGKAPVRKTQLIDVVDKRIREVAKSRSFIKALTEAERATLGILLKKKEGTGTQRDVILPLMAAGLIYIEGQKSTGDLPTFTDVLRSLLRKGLIVNLTAPAGGSSRRTFKPVQQFGIPPEVKDILPRNLLPIPEPRSEAQSIAPPTHVKSGDLQQYLRQLFFMWAELRRAPAKRLKSGYIAKRDLRRIAKSIGVELENNEARITKMQSMLTALNLLDITPSAISAADNSAVKLFWTASPRAQMATVLQSYPSLGIQIPMDLRSVARYTYYSSFPTRPASEIRSQILALLKDVATTHWFPYSLFIAFLSRARSGSIAFSDYTLNTIQRSMSWYTSRQRNDLSEALNRLDQQVVVAVLEELRDLGVVDIGYASSEGPPTALLLAPLARAHFANQHLPAPEVQGQVVLQPDFQILAMGPVPLHDLAILERFAVREKFDESVVSYRITRDSVYQAFQRDESSKTIQAFLEEATGQPVPQNIRRTLEEWGGQYERIIIRRDITIMQTDQASLLDNLLADKSIRRYIHRLDERTAWIHARDMARLEAQLWKSEILPTSSQGPDADLPRSLLWDNGELRPRRPLPSLYVTGTLRRIAESGDDSHYRLTPQSIRNATTAGMDIPSIIALLERMTGKPIPIQWHKQLKAWGKHYGDGQVARVTLLHLDSDEALRELRRLDRRLGRLIRPLPQARGVGVVDEKRWDDVQALLEEWGIHIDKGRWW